MEVGHNSLKNISICRFKVENKTYVERESVGPLQAHSMIDQLQDLVIDLPVFDFALLRLLDFMLLLSQLLLEDGDLRLLLAVLFMHLMGGQTFVTYRILQCVQTLLHFLVRLLVIGQKLKSVLTDRFAGRIHVSKLQIAETGP